MKSVHDAGAVLNPPLNGLSGLGGLFSFFGGVLGSDASGLLESTSARGMTEPLVMAPSERKRGNDWENSIFETVLERVE